MTHDHDMLKRPTVIVGTVHVAVAVLYWVVLGVGPNGVFTAIMIAFSTLTIVSGTLLKRGKWKEASV